MSIIDAINKMRLEEDNNLVQQAEQKEDNDNLEYNFLDEMEEVAKDEEFEIGGLRTLLFISFEFILDFFSL